MKSLTFNQLQLRVLVLLFFLFTSALVSYKYFIELPKLERSISLLAERELDTLTFSIKNLLKDVSRISSDYAAWTATYEFIHDHNQNYIDENLVDHTFKIIEVDGMFFINENLELVFGKGLHYKTGKPLDFSFYDFKKIPRNLSMLPATISDKGSVKSVGFLNTQNGPAIYNVNQIRKSDLTGEYRGFLITIKLIEESFIDSLSEHTLTKVSLNPIDQNEPVKALSSWNEKLIITTVKPFTKVLIADMNNQPVVILKMEHSVGSMPDLFNQKGFIFSILLSILFYLIYQLISLTIIIPVKKLAHDIKIMDQNKACTQLNEDYTVKELITVSKNVNHLLLTVQKQNELLAKKVSIDQLTQVMNRHGLQTELDKYKYECIRLNIGFVLVMCDIDYFKNYNDSLGHMKGDDTLFLVAQMLNRLCKRSADVCARFGGEEFILLFSEMTIEDLHKKMQGMINAMETLNIPHPKSTTASHVTISLGAAIVQPSDVCDFSLPIEAIIKSADSALYQAKANGRNQFVINYFSPN